MRFAVVMALSAAALWAETVAGVGWTSPSTWKNEGSRPMRAASYVVPAAAGDSEPGECVAYYFGEGQGGTVDANVLRWKGQFLGPDGSVSIATKTGQRKVNGLTVDTVEAAGVYTGMGGPMAKEHPKKPGYRLLGAIVDAPQGLVFFKFAGPAKTVAANEAAFWKMIASVTRK